MGTFRENEQTWHQYNNQWAWWIVDWGVSAAYLGDDDAMERMKRLYRARDSWTTRITGESSNRPWTDYRVVDSNQGYFHHERQRDRGFHYTGYNLRALAQICVLAETWDGTDLWSFNAPTDPGSGSTLRKAFEWFDSYVTDVWSWGWDANPPPNTETRQEAACAYELANARWGGFDAPIENPSGISGRPHHDIRLLGPVTLTHGRA
jgi:hypothetical protein